MLLGQEPNQIFWEESRELIREKGNFIVKLISFPYIIQAELSKHVVFLLKSWFFIHSLGFSTYIMCCFVN